jgi:hypothetical protein
MLNMKTKFIILFSLVAAFAGCKPESLPGIGEPHEKLTFAEGNWQLDKVVQTDLNAVKYNFPYKELDVTAVAPFTQFKLSLTLNNGASGNFTTTPGSAPAIIPLTDGKWEVDDINTPKQFNLIKGTDTVKMKIGSYNTLSGGRLHLQHVKNDGSKDLLRYDYYFKKI